jgi:hypothetical protein
MVGYTYYRYLTYLTELLLLIMLTYYKVLTWFLHVLLLCPRWPQSEHLIGDSSGSRNSLCRRSRLLRGRPCCCFVTAGGLVTPSYSITNFGFSASTHLTLPISMVGYTYYRYLTYLTELLLLIMLTYYKFNRTPTSHHVNLLQSPNLVLACSFIASSLATI